MSNTPHHPSPPESSQPDEKLRVALTRPGDLGQVHVELESFVALNVWMSRELAELEDCFAHFQTRNSTSRRKNRRS